MRRSTSLKASLAAAVAVGCLVPAVLLIGAAPAAVTASSTSTAHKCLVMTGSGDPAFTKNFNPYTATGLPSGTIVQGAFYEPLLITPLGGLPTVPWLARTWKWTNGAKTLTLNLARGAKWSDGKPLTSTDVVYSLNAGKQDKLMDRIGLTGDDNNIASIKAKGKYKSRHQPEDARLAVHLLDPQPRVRRAEARLDARSKTSRTTRTRSRSARGPST